MSDRKDAGSDVGKRCQYCADQPEPGRIETDNNGPIVDCPVCRSGCESDQTCTHCGALVSDDGYSIDDRCCYYCSGK